MVARLAMKPDYSPREFGERLTPARSSQWVLVRIWNGEIEATKTSSGWRLSHQELRRFSGQDLTMPGHEGVSSERDGNVRELRRLHAETQRLCAEMGKIIAELEG